MRNPLIVILTDFGQSDPYAGIMKGVIAKINPRAQTIDLTHHIPPGDLLQSGIQLWRAVPFFPAGTIFLVVVDPGVGTRRRGMIAQSGDKFFIGPDNGVFSFILRDSPGAWELRDSRFQLPEPSVTFHGRDIFAPAAAYFAMGISPEEFGPWIGDPIRMQAPKLAYNAPEQIDGEILFADHFGNLLTSLGQFSLDRGRADRAKFHPWLPVAGVPKLSIDFPQAVLSLPSGQTMRTAGTFMEILPGECAAVIGSSGLVEIAANGGSAAEILKVPRGTGVSLAWFNQPE
jgi:S-adenosylmethionine hydrolase